MSTLNRQNVLTGMVRGTGWLAMAMLFAIMVLVFSDAFGTKLFSRPIPGALEITEELMALVILLGLAMTERERGHLRVTILTDRMPKRWRDILNFAGYHVLGIIIMSLLCWRSIVLLQGFIAIGTLKQGIVALAVWPTALGFVLGSLIFVFVLLSLAVKGLSLFRQRETVLAVGVEENR